MQPGVLPMRPAYAGRHVAVKHVHESTQSASRMATSQPITVQRVYVIFSHCTEGNAPQSLQDFYTRLSSDW